MTDYEAFLKTYDRVNECLHLGMHGRHRLSLIDMPDARRYMQARDVIPYATLLYAMNLLSQVVVTHFSTSLVLRSDKEKENSFPEIFGILSTANMHVCPSVPATIVIYCSMEEFDKNYAPWNQKLERQVWDDHIEEFNAAVSWVSNNLHGALITLCGHQLDDSHENEVKKRYLEEHESVKIEIHKPTHKSMRVTNS